MIAVQITPAAFTLALTYVNRHRLTDPELLALLRGLAGCGVVDVERIERVMADIRAAHPALPTRAARTTRPTHLAVVQAD